MPTNCDQSVSLKVQIQAAMEAQAAATVHAGIETQAQTEGQLGEAEDPADTVVIEGTDEAKAAVEAVGRILDPFMNHMVVDRCEECLTAAFAFAASQPGHSWSGNDNLFTAVEFYLVTPQQWEKFERIAKGKFPREEPMAIVNEWWELIKERGIGTLGGASESLRYACKQFDPKQIELEGESALSRFLRSRFEFFCKSRQDHVLDPRRISIDLGDDVEADHQPWADAVAIGLDNLKFADFCLNKMRARHQDWEIIADFHLAGLSHGDIATNRGITTANSRVRLNRAMKEFLEIAAAWLELEHLEPNLAQVLITRCLKGLDATQSAIHCGCPEIELKRRQRAACLALCRRIKAVHLTRCLGLDSLEEDFQNIALNGLSIAEACGPTGWERNTLEVRLRGMFDGLIEFLTLAAQPDALSDDELFAFVAVDLLKLSTGEVATAEVASGAAVAARLRNARRLLRESIETQWNHLARVPNPLRQALMLVDWVKVPVDEAAAFLRIPNEELLNRLREARGSISRKPPGTEIPARPGMTAQP